MDLQHFHRSSILPVIALGAFPFSASAMLACTRPALDDSRSMESADTEGDISQPPPPTAPSSRFTLFESGQVRPLAMSPDKQHLFAVNTPDNRLEIFRIKPN